MSIYENGRSVDPTTQLIYCRTPIETIEQHVRTTLTTIIAPHSSDSPNNTAATTHQLTRHDVKCAIILLLGYTPSHIELNTLLHTQTPPHHTHTNTEPHTNNTNNNTNTPTRTMSIDHLITHLTTRIAHQDTLTHYQHLFTALDTTHSNFIRRTDFLALCEHIVSSSSSGLDRVWLERVFDVCDVDGDGLVSYREFDRLMSGRPYASIG